MSITDVAGGRRVAGPGGPDDGGSSRAARAGRRFGLGVVVVAIIAVILLFSVGIDLWTDALWFQSVGFDSVFWTRIGATLGLGVGAFLIAAVVLLGNLWLAGRLAPPPGEGGRVASARWSTGSTTPPRRPTIGAAGALAVRPRPRPVGRPDRRTRSPSTSATCPT